ncbi:MAG: DUF2399 domain-containing protein [Actinobacteria bacterium]|nr:DUF2399 domain-containing protein [Actinomycetota bacterium]
MAERVLREGIRGRRRWSTLRSRSGPDFSPIVVELELLDDLCRSTGLLVEDTWHLGRWVVDSFMVDQSMRGWLGLVDPEIVQAELREELRRPVVVAALSAGPPSGIDWRSYAFVLRAAERVEDLAEHGSKPSARELAGLVDHTKAWTSRRRELLAEIVGRPFEEIVNRLDRQIGIRGPVAHPEGGIWASAVKGIDLAVTDEARGVILVENAETFRVLSALADLGWVVLHVPGGPPPAECELIERLSALAPDLVFHAAFDLDPAGIRIVRLIERRTGLRLECEAMSPGFLRRASKTLDLSEWDREQLARLHGDSGSLEDLRDEIARTGHKVEQETFQRQLVDLFTARGDAGRTERAAPADIRPGL